MSRLLLPVIALAVSLAAACSSPDAGGDPDAPPSGVGTPEPAASIPGLAMSDTALARHFGDRVGTFVLVDDATGAAIRHNPERAGTRFIPASTFKIPNTLIALETGVASGPEFRLAWDSTVAPREDWWPASWAGPHTLRSALPASAVWYYQELARRIGPERMTEHLERFDYGNASIEGGIDRFWLTGALRISADEQVAFLRRFYHGRLGASEASTATARELLVLEETPDYRFSGKTGWAALGAQGLPDVGWVVGYVERGGGVYFYALNLEVRGDADVAARMGITRAILGELGLVDAR